MGTNFEVNYGLLLSEKLPEEFEKFFLEMNDYDVDRDYDDILPNHEFFKKHKFDWFKLFYGGFYKYEINYEQVWIDEYERGKSYIMASIGEWKLAYGLSQDFLDMIDKWIIGGFFAHWTEHQIHYSNFSLYYPEIKEDTTE